MAFYVVLSCDIQKCHNVQVLTEEAASLEQQAPKLAAKAVELTKQLQKEEEVLPLQLIPPAHRLPDVSRLPDANSFLLMQMTAYWLQGA